MLILQIAAIIGVMTPLTIAKVYEKCDLARELNEIHGISKEDVATFVCIAEHQSRFNTTAIGQGMYYGIFQMSSEFWCDTYYSDGKACEINCDDLIDDDLSDDLQCMRKIIDEHKRISGNGFNAWPSGVSCQSMSYNYLSDCSIESNEIIPKKSINYNNVQSFKKISGSYEKDESKVYERCELARELRYQHNIPLNEIATWVCIAKHESNFNTSAIGRLNWDGSEDHGLFQISDIYWCGTQEKAKACNSLCSEFRDSDITNDIRCIRKIHEEHNRLSGDGFNAWTVYKTKCKGKSSDFIKGCFDEQLSNEILPIKPNPGVQQHDNKISYYNFDSKDRRVPEKIIERGKIYDRCELAQELRYKFKIPMEQVATWVCIAKQESNFDTSAIGRLNSDGSEDHGIFQISDLYWCNAGEGQGKGCNLACSELEDSDISNDVECMLKIYEEHTYLSGDGFNAWTTYTRCKLQSVDYINGCFNDDENLIPHVKPGILQPTTKLPINNNFRKWKESVTVTDNYLYETIPQETTTYAPISKHKTTLEAKEITQNSKNIVKQHQQTHKKEPFSIIKTLTRNADVLKKGNEKEINRQNILTTPKAPLTTSMIPNNSQKQPSITTIKPKNDKILSMASKMLTTQISSPRIKSKTTRAYSTTVKSILKPSSFNIFAFYLNDYTSKRPSIDFKPIVFDSKKSTVIINNKNKNALDEELSLSKVINTHQHQKNSSMTPIKAYSKKSWEQTTTPKSLSTATIKTTFFKNEPINDLTQNRVGRVLENITPHSIDYLLKLTTPKTFYGKR